MYLFKLKKHAKCCQKKICIENNCDLVVLKIVIRVKSLDIIKNKRTTARPRDTRILVPEKNRAAQNRAS